MVSLSRLLIAFQLYFATKGPVFVFVYILDGVQGFVQPATCVGSTRCRGISRHFVSFDLMDTVTQATSNAILVATIDADVASLSENEFKPVFMGGLVVMFGGLISALIVGLIVDSRNLYASLVADSYAQSGDDEEFWKGLSEEEKNKAKDVLRKFKEAQLPSSVDDRLSLVSKPSTTKQNSELSNITDQKLQIKEMPLFSDYSNEP